MMEQKQEIHATVSINNVQYEVIKNFRDGFSEEAFKERYAEILNKYDYIVGDWGYEQLRLRGFFDDSNQRATYDTKISTLSEYLYEYCNFGCAHFVLRKVKKKNPLTIVRGFLYILIYKQIEIRSPSESIVFGFICCPFN